MSFFQSQYFAFDPYFENVWLYLALAVLAIIWGVSLWRARRSRILRTCLAGIVTLGILNPTLVEEEREALPSVVAVVVDTSESMRFGDRAQIAQSVVEQLNTQFNDLPNFDVRVTQTDPKADGSHLIGALKETLADVPREQIGGAILISDGQVHDIPNSLEALKDFGPIHAIITGDPDKKDRRLEIVKRTSFGVVGEVVQYTIKVIDPTAIGQAIDLRLTLNTQAAQTFTLIEGQEKQIDIEVERRGENIAIFEVEVGENELTLANNVQTETISGVFDRLRVLLVTGFPNAAGRVWRDLLKADPSVDLVHFTILRPPFKTDGARMEELSLINFPTDALFQEKLDRFNLIIFDQYERRHVITDAYLNNMARYVDDGGALLVVSGPPFASRNSIARSPLRSVLPAAPNNKIFLGHMKPELSDIGKRHTVTQPLIAAEKNWGGWYRYIGAQSDVGDVLMQSDTGAPLLVLNRVGEGRVGQLLSDQIWLWARGHEGGGPYVDLIRRLVHWLMKEPELEERQIRMEMAENGESASIILKTVTDIAAPLSLQDPEGGLKRLEWTTLGDGQFKAQTPTPNLGLYRAFAGGLQAVALKGPNNPLEYRQPSTTTDLLKPVTVETKGGIFSVLSLVNADQAPQVRAVKPSDTTVGRDWVGLKKRDAYIVKNTKAASVFPGALGAFLFMLTALLLWWREGR